MSDFKSALLGAVIGGLISTGAQWMTAHMSEKKDIAAEKRQKLEEFVGTAINLKLCETKISEQRNVYLDCYEENIYRLTTLSRLYFPEAEKEANKMIDDFIEVIKDREICSAKGLQFEQCSKSIPFSTQTMVDTLDSLLNTAKDIAATLQ